MFKRCFLLILFMISPYSWAWTPAPVHEYTLENGLKLLVKQDYRAPVVVSQVWYKVGSSYEHLGITGVSHVLEHMMFKGTTSHPPGEFSRIIAENGGQENAFTSRDYTGYYQQLEKSRLPISFELEADRMRNILLDQDEFEKELKVVMEERRLRVEDKPQSVTVEQFYATAFTNSPYRNPVIGWMNDLENMTLDDLKQWYETWYAPNNATVVVVGDVDPNEVHQLAKKYFGPLKPTNITPLKPRKEIPQRGTRYIEVKAPAELPVLIMGYKVPVIMNAVEEWEPYALEVLASVLSGGGSSRIIDRLVRGSAIAAGAAASYSGTSRHDDIFMLSGTPTPGHSVKDLENALTNEVMLIKETPPLEDELDRVKAQVVSSAVYQQDSIYYQAMELGALTTIGLDWRLTNEYVDRIRDVTPEQVQAVAKKYLIPDHLTVAVLEPLPLTDAKPSAEGGAHHVR